MLSKADIKYLNSLQNKKYRKIEHAFLVEGQKNVEELLRSSYQVLRLFCTEKAVPQTAQLAQMKGIVLEIISETVLQTLGTLENNQSALAVAKIPEPPAEVKIGDTLVLALDGINDPGNLGTIIRTADWYGISTIVCSPDTVDVYNPKVINASKGSFTRLQVLYEDLSNFFSKHKQATIYATCLEGNSVNGIQLKGPSVLLMGNEANGIRPQLLQIATHKISIPRFGQAESLNVGVATGILLDRLVSGK